MISCISSIGWHFNLIRNQSINPQIFSEFVIDLEKFTNSRQSEKSKRLVLLLDNTPIHKTKDFQELLNKTFNFVIYLPTYSLLYALVKHYFPVTKNKIINEHKGIKVGMKSEIETRKLRSAMLIVEQKGIVRMWAHWLYKMKLLVHHFTNHTDYS